MLFQSTLGRDFFVKIISEQRLDRSERGDYDDFCKGKDSQSKGTVSVMALRMRKIFVFLVLERDNLCL